MLANVARKWTEGQKTKNTSGREVKGQITPTAAQGLLRLRRTCLRRRCQHPRRYKVRCVRTLSNACIGLGGVVAHSLFRRKGRGSAIQGDTQGEKRWSNGSGGGEHGARQGCVAHKTIFHSVSVSDLDLFAVSYPFRAPIRELVEGSRIALSCESESGKTCEPV